MVAQGKLVKEECSVDSKARMGTIVKVTDIVLHKSSQWENEVARWVSYNNNNGNSKPDMNMCHIIRPGKVASVRWQDDPSRVTIHVFYSDCSGQSHCSFGSNTVTVV